MEDQIYLYHYYPLSESQELKDIENIECETIDSLLEKNGAVLEPYRSLHRAMFPLAKQKIWISSVEALNDPFECQIYFLPEFFNSDEMYEYFQKQDNSITKEELQALVHNDAQKNGGYIPFSSLGGKFSGIFSLCKNNECPLMWSYYASGHSGICIRFKIHSDLKQVVEKQSQIQLIKYRDGPAFIFGNVKYENDQPPIFTNSHYSYYQNCHSQLYPQFREQGIEMGVCDLMFLEGLISKAPIWGREQEFRLIGLGLENEVFLPSLKYPGTNKRPIEADAIIFGMRTDSIVKKIIQNSFNIPFYEASMIQGTYKLAINLID